MEREEAAAAEPAAEALDPVAEAERDQVAVVAAALDHRWAADPVVAAAVRHGRQRHQDLPAALRDPPGVLRDPLAADRGPRFRTGPGPTGPPRVPRAAPRNGLRWALNRAVAAICPTGPAPCRVQDKEQDRNQDKASHRDPVLVRPAPVRDHRCLAREHRVPA